MIFLLSPLPTKCADNAAKHSTAMTNGITHHTCSGYTPKKGNITGSSGGIIISKLVNASTKIVINALIILYHSATIVANYYISSLNLIKFGCLTESFVSSIPVNTAHS